MSGTGLLRLAGGLVLGATLWGCAPRPVLPDLGPTPSYDGHYIGSVQVSGAASGINASECATNPGVTFDVKNNAFAYTQPHPSVAGTAPALTVAATTTTYNAEIDPDGTIRGESGDVGGTISGKVAGRSISGQINGVLCYYSFSATRG
jgi:hypothetical protein